MLNYERINHNAKKYLKNIDPYSINMERIESISSLTGDETIKYVQRTIDVLDNISGLTIEQYTKIKAALEWAETGKTSLFPEGFKKTGIHNYDSADLYKMYYETDGIIPLLIECHGMIGQAIRGEVSLSKYFYKLKHITDYLYSLTHCVIAGVSDELWESIKDEVALTIEKLKTNQYTDYSVIDRLSRLKPGFGSKNTTIVIPDEVNRIFNNYDFWYVEGTLHSFTDEEFIKILNMVSDVIEKKESQICHCTEISFKMMMDDLYYDYNGKKYINIYKKRIIEDYLCGNTSEHITFTYNIDECVIFPVFKYTEACSSLLDFCVKAERSGVLSYEKAITFLFDMFGFRKDKFDRLNNEGAYLDTMNDMKASTKSDIPNYVVGKDVVDVGSGGGAMLLELEKKFPDKNIIGTDISAEVINMLCTLQKEHKFIVKRHNFVDGPLDKKVDTIIFSSILHEIFSYTEYEGKYFNINSVKKAIKNAYNSLNPGGRLIIRDGIRCSKDRAVLTLHSENATESLKNYLKDFKGLPDISRNHIEIADGYEEIIAPLDYIREFLYTYTWGKDSYAHEVQEQFGYFTYKEYILFLSNELECDIVKGFTLLEDGYLEHLQDITIHSVCGKKMELPESNCFIVAEKKLTKEGK